MSAKIDRFFLEYETLIEFCSIYIAYLSKQLFTLFEITLIMVKLRTIKNHESHYACNYRKQKTRKHNINPITPVILEYQCCDT